MHSGHKQPSLFFQDFFSDFHGPVALLDQGHIIDQHFDGQPGAAHTLDKLNPSDVEFTLFPNPAFIPGHGWDKSDPFIVVQGVQ